MVAGWVILATLISFLLSLCIKKWSHKNKIGLAEPRERDLHKKPIPRLGGLAIVGSFLIVYILIIAVYGDQGLGAFGFPYKLLIPVDKRLLGIIVSTLLIAGIMVIDDIRGVKAYYKLGAQILAAFLLILTGVGIVYLNNPFGNTLYLNGLKIPVELWNTTYHLVLWADLFFVFWVVLLTNATNFIDGLDGLAASLSLVALIILGALSFQLDQPATALLALVVAGAVLGFLYFNLPPAKMFLGDTGAMFLGLILAVISVISGGKLATLLLVFALVILDALYVIVRRLVKGQNPLTSPDQSHLHHRFLKAGFSPRSTLLIIVVVSLAFGLSSLFLPSLWKIYSLIILSILSIGLFYFLDRKTVA